MRTQSAKFKRLKQGRSARVGAPVQIFLRKLQGNTERETKFELPRRQGFPPPRSCDTLQILAASVAEVGACWRRRRSAANGGVTLRGGASRARVRAAF